MPTTCCCYHSCCCCCCCCCYWGIMHAPYWCGSLLGQAIFGGSTCEYVLFSICLDISFSRVNLSATRLLHDLLTLLQLFCMHWCEYECFSDAARLSFPRFFSIFVHSFCCLLFLRYAAGRQAGRQRWHHVLHPQRWLHSCWYAWRVINSRRITIYMHKYRNKYA